MGDDQHAKFIAFESGWLTHPLSQVVLTLSCEAKLVYLARFERATSTFAESRSHSTELQVREVDWRKGQDLNLQATNAR